VNTLTIEDIPGSTLDEKLAGVKTLFADIKKAKMEISKQLFSAASKALFEKFPKLEKFSWAQYTPHFNDGDTCSFSVHTDTLRSFVYDGESGYDGEETYIEIYNIGREFDMTLRKYVDVEVGEVEECLKAISNFLESFDEDYFEESFGDHVEVIVTRDNVETEEYDHD
jgi:hypothetical protein